MKINKFVDERLLLYKKNISGWASKHYVNLAVFNFLIFLLVLLRIGNYFDPYLPISINIIMFLTFIMAVTILGAGSGVMFFVALLFWLGAAFMGILKINVWAERFSIYVFQSLLVAVLLLFIDNYCLYNTKRHAR